MKEMYKSTFNKIGFSMGRDFMMFSNAQGEVYGLGCNDHGQLGNGTTTFASTPVKANIDNVIMFDCGWDYTVFLTADGDVYISGTDYAANTTPSDQYCCWHYNKKVLTPVKISSECIAVTTGLDQIQMITNTGTVRGYRFCIARPDNYNDTSSTTVVDFVRLAEIKGIACGWSEAIWVNVDGTAKCIKDNSHRTMPSSLPNNTFSNFPITNIKAVEFSHYDATSHVLKNDGTVYGCGVNTEGQLGIGNLTNQTSYAQCDITGVEQISNAPTHTLFLKSNGEVWVSGSNEYGQLGLGNDVTFCMSPTKLNMSGVLGIYAAYNFSAFLTDNGLYFAGKRPF